MRLFCVSLTSRDVNGSSFSFNGSFGVFSLGLGSRLGLGFGLSFSFNGSFGVFSLGLGSRLGLGFGLSNSFGNSFGVFSLGLCNVSSFFDLYSSGASS